MIAGQGINLPYPQPVTPGLPFVSPALAYQPQGGPPITVTPGQSILLAPGWNMVKLGLYTCLEFEDPVSGLWIPFSFTHFGMHQIVNSDGNNIRVTNPTGTPIGGYVTNVGSGYVAGATTAALSVGNSTWSVIVGNAVSAIAVGNDSKGNAGGTNFTIPPIVDIQAPPPGGLQATARAVLTGGAVTSVVLVNQGAGYTSGVPSVVLRPNQFDPNLGLITVPTVTATLTAAGQVAAVICTNPGRPLTAGEIAGPPTLTISGAGASAAASPIIPQTVTAVAYSNSGGAGYAGTAVRVGSVGGVITTAAGAIVNPSWGVNLLPNVREFNIYSPVSAGAAGAAVIIDGGLYSVAPTGITLATPGTAAPGTLTVPTLTMGSANDVVWIQQLGGWA